MLVNSRPGRSSGGSFHVS